MLLSIKKIIKKVLNYNQSSYTGNDLIQHNRVKPWFKDKGDETLRVNYPLNENSIIFDVGGFKGEFAMQMIKKYNSQIYIFEPVEAFFLVIKEKFLNNPNVKCFNYGLAGHDQELEINVAHNASSIYLNSNLTETIQLKSLVDFIKVNNIKHIDLIKINIEGGEYELLESLLDSNCITMIDNIQVQFHDFIIDNAKERMNKIQNRLLKTHMLTYQYEFVWENWKLQ